MTPKRSCKKYLVPQPIHFPLGKNKDKACEAFQKRSATTKVVRVHTYDQVNKAVLKWFIITMLRKETITVTVTWYTDHRKSVGFCRRTEHRKLKKEQKDQHDKSA